MSQRLPGLDTLRAAAIALVLLYHYQVVALQGANLFGPVGDLGWAGVDLFFVLSGYLIGNQVMAPIAHGERFSLKLFYIRRFLRTLPNYWVLLALYFLFPMTMAGKEPSSLWRFLSFTQNIGLKAGSAFSHAWSLSVEEQFYLILPAVALLLAALGRSVRLAWMVLGGAIACGVAMRAFMWLHCVDFDGYMTGIYYSSFCRMDEFLPGVALAMLRNFHPVLHLRLQAWGNAAAVAGVAWLGFVLAAFYFFLDGDSVLAHGFNPLLTAFGYSALALGFALLVFSATCPGSLLGRLRVPGAASLALWSYAIYLAHKPLYFIGANLASQAGFVLDSGMTAAPIIACGVAGGYLLYRCIETPFMALRARYFSAGSASPAATAGAG